MSKITKVLLVAIVSVAMTSCYTSKVAVGNASVTASTIQINKVKNPSLIAGLVPLKGAYSAKDYVGDKQNYVIKNQWTFVDGLLNCITFGIYTPTTTTFHIPVEDAKK